MRQPPEREAQRVKGIGAFQTLGKSDGTEPEFFEFAVP